MAEFPFDTAHPERRDWSLIFPTPLECAQYLWDQPFDALSFEEACELASIDPEVHSALWDWSVQQDDLTDVQKLKLYDALILDVPRAGKAKTVYRDNKFRRIAAELGQAYELPPSVDGKHRAASVLCKIKGVAIDRKRIANILYTQN